MAKELPLRSDEIVLKAKGEVPISCVDFVPPILGAQTGSLYVRLRERSIFKEYPSSVIHEVQTYEHRENPKDLKSRVEAALSGIELRVVPTDYLDVWHATYPANSKKIVRESIYSLPRISS